MKNLIAFAFLALPLFATAKDDPTFDSKTLRKGEYMSCGAYRYGADQYLYVLLKDGWHTVSVYPDGGYQYRNIEENYIVHDFWHTPSQSKALEITHRKTQFRELLVCKALTTAELKSFIEAVL